MKLGKHSYFFRNGSPSEIIFNKGADRQQEVEEQRQGERVKARERLQIFQGRKHADLSWNTSGQRGSSESTLGSIQQNPVFRIEARKKGIIMKNWDRPVNLGSCPMVVGMVPEK